MRDAAEGVRTALRVVVRDHGRRVAEDPTRVRALLVDALGPDAREARAELDAVVVAAEEGVPAAVGASPSAKADARARLEQRGLSPAMARVAVHCWDAVLVTDPAASTAGVSATATVSGTRPVDGPGGRPASRPARRPGSRPGEPRSRQPEPLAPTEIPTPPTVRGPTVVPMAGEPRTPGAQADGLDHGVRDPDRTMDPRRRLPVLTVHRSSMVVAGAAALAVAFSAGLLGPGVLDGRNGTAQLTASGVSPTAPTVTATSVVRVTTVRTQPVTRSVTRTVTVDASKLKAVSDRYTTQPYLSWSGNKTCALKAPSAKTKAYACYGIYHIRATGSQKSWKVLSATVTGKGRVEPDGTDINYYYAVNGPYAATVSFVIGSGSYRSKGTLRIQMDCNPNLPCSKALP